MLEVKQISKSIKDKKISYQINLKVDEGEIYGLLDLMEQAKQQLSIS